MTTKFYCSNISKASKEQLVGSAPEISHLLLIEYSGFWPSNIEESTILSPYVNLIKDIKKMLPKFSIKLIKNSDTGKGKELSQIFYYNKILYSKKISLKQDLKFIFNSILNNDFSDKKQLFKPIYFICSHGIRDKCCAKFGLPIFNELNKENENVWQVSHLGGHRFAPTMLVLPSMNCYGHLEIKDLKDLIYLTNNNKILFNKWRGNSNFKSCKQVAIKSVLEINNLLIDDIVSVLTKQGQDCLKVMIKFKTGIEYQELIKEVILESNDLSCNQNQIKIYKTWKLLHNKPVG